MRNNPDVYLLYEYMEKIPFTVRRLSLAIVLRKSKNLQKKKELHKYATNTGSYYNT